MSARDAIFRALGGAPEPDAPTPPRVYAPPRVETDDLFERFAASLAAAGGRARAVPGGASALADALRAHPAFASARQIWSSLPEILPRLPDGSPRAPHDLARLDVALLAGTLAVAESGAVWWAPHDPLERAACFLAEHVVLVVPRSALVADLHAAYAQIALAASSFGCFLCGPSKTADIEQALVIGAHGPCSLEVWLV